ncbi:Conserved_hypothetical protein [Hexamita inflata]|uniref:Uncharacterized protein n=1 Tax=Hexamita inflata TaxID=28002 RepID=A0AA86TRX0_9EUKA|nr:Conserved hypothetical protein [Hexamita inflata]CAI9924372.1 Conserved hypothetical protein [Hexamita inflata]CAI9925530.1 Conserved hypothetical protein [Hexamita inflata]
MGCGVEQTITQPEVQIDYKPKKYMPNKEFASDSEDNYEITNQVQDEPKTQISNTLALSHSNTVNTQQFNLQQRIKQQLPMNGIADFEYLSIQHKQQKIQIEHIQEYFMEKKVPLSGKFISVLIDKSQHDNLVSCAQFSHLSHLVSNVNQIKQNHQKRRKIIIKQNSHDDKHLIQAVIVQRILDLKMKQQNIILTKQFTQLPQITVKQAKPEKLVKYMEVVTTSEQLNDKVTKLKQKLQLPVFKLIQRWSGYLAARSDSFRSFSLQFTPIPVIKPLVKQQVKLINVVDIQAQKEYFKTKLSVQTRINEFKSQTQIQELKNEFGTLDFGMIQFEIESVKNRTLKIKPFNTQTMIKKVIAKKCKKPGFERTIDTLIELSENYSQNRNEIIQVLMQHE